MRHEPSGFVRHAERAVQLMAGDAFLGRRKQVGCVKPLVQGHMAVLENGAHGHAKGLLARAALVDAGARALAL